VKIAFATQVMVKQWYEIEVPSGAELAAKEMGAINMAIGCADDIEADRIDPDPVHVQMSGAEYVQGSAHFVED
jgi:hypothetical protein